MGKSPVQIKWLVAIDNQNIRWDTANGQVIAIIGKPYNIDRKPRGVLTKLDMIITVIESYDIVSMGDCQVFIGWR